MDPESLLERIKRHEGFVPRMYHDPVGIPTIGYGHNLYTPITRSAAEVILRDDLLRAMAQYHQIPPRIRANLDPVRAEVVVEMIFNMGIKKVMGFRKMLAALEQRDFHTAAEEMLRSQWAAQVGARAQKLARIMREGQRR